MRRERRRSGLCAGRLPLEGTGRRGRGAVRGEVLVNPKTPAALTRTQLGVLLAGLVVSRLLWTRACPIYDDAFITYRYARNMAAGHGLVFNPGAPWEPVLGTTAPGYAVLLAGLHALGLPLIGASLTVNFLADAVSLVLVARLVRRALPVLAIAVTFAAMPDLGRISSGGMEAPLFCCLALAAIAAWKNARPQWAGLAASLACTLRPEAVLLVAILGVAALPAPRQLARFAVPVAFVGIVYAGSLTLIYGSPIPQSVSAKAATHVVKVPSGRLAEILELAFFPIRYMALGLPLVLVGLVRSLRQDRGLAPFSLLALAMTAAYLVARPKTWGWYYYVPLTAWALWLGLGTEAGLRRLLPRAVAALERAPLSSALAAALVAVALVSVAGRLRPDRVTPNVYERMAEWVRKERIDERGARIVASDIGAIGWYADARILDSMGLVWPRAVDYADQLDVIRDAEADYVLVVATRPRLGSFLADDRLVSTYTPVERFSTFGARDLHPAIDSLPGGWVQDYLVFRRTDASR